MARKPKTNPKAPGASAEKPSESAGAGHNNLTDDELRTLAIQHRDKIAVLKAAKDKAVANLRNAYKSAKAELGKDAKQIIDDMLALTDEAGEVEMRNRLQRQAAALRWAGYPLGSQIELSLGEPDRTPSVDHAFDEGKACSMANKPAKPGYAPETEQYRSYMDGYQEDQARRAGTIGRGNPTEH